MRIEPTGCELLATARKVLDERIRPYLSVSDEPLLRQIEAAITVAGELRENAAGDRRADVHGLEAARTALRGTLLGRLPADRQYDARLVAKVMAIAANELANGHRPQRDELDSLTALMHAQSQSIDSVSVDLNERLTCLYAGLSSAIRGGDIDPGSSRYTATYEHLHRITREAVSESNPAYLAARQRS